MADIYVGVMSGTSMDGVDAVVCEMRGHRFVKVVAHKTLQYAPALRKALLSLQAEEHAISLRQFAEFDSAIARAFAEAAVTALPSRNARAIGVHGQTVFHEPSPPWMSSLQIGNPSLIAHLTGQTVVADFRRADIACGGQGAPLVPAFHHAVFASKLARAVLNIGGISNLTLLPDEDASKVRGWDIGPGNALMDEWIKLSEGKDFDRAGAFAASGKVHEPLLEALLEDSYFQQAPPKSTGRGYFNITWALKRFPDLHLLPAENVQRSFCELTAILVARALQTEAPTTSQLLVCGGGTQNNCLMDRIRALNPQVAVMSTSEFGLDPQAVEGAAFAWLAMCRMHGLTGSLPAVTGASRPAILGGVYAP